MNEIIIELEEELRQAMLSSNVEKLDKLIDNALIFVTPDGKIATKQMDLEAHKNKVQTMSRLNFSEQKIQFHGKFAVVTTKATIEGLFNNINISGDYRYLRVWAKTNDSWKIISGAVTKIN